VDATAYQTLTGVNPSSLTMDWNLSVQEQDWDNDSISNRDELILFKTDPTNSYYRPDESTLVIAMLANQVSATTLMKNQSLISGGGTGTGTGNGTGDGGTGPVTPPPVTPPPPDEEEMVDAELWDVEVDVYSQAQIDHDNAEYQKGLQRLYDQYGSFAAIPESEKQALREANPACWQNSSQATNQRETFKGYTKVSQTIVNASVNTLAGSVNGIFKVINYIYRLIGWAVD
jgi:hypothetical protein